MLTGSAWDNTVSTADTPNYATRLGVQTANLLINVQELCGCQHLSLMYFMMMTNVTLECSSLCTNSSFCNRALVPQDRQADCAC